MPKNRPGNMFYTVNSTGSGITHGAPCLSEGRVGVSVKQKAPAWSAGFSSQKVIANGEDFAMIVKGIVEVAEVAGFAVGDAVYITAGNVLTEVKTGNTKYGRVVEIEGERGTPTNKVRIDLDAKDSF